MKNYLWFCSMDCYAWKISKSTISIILLFHSNVGHWNFHFIWILTWHILLVTIRYQQIWEYFLLYKYFWYHNRIHSYVLWHLYCFQMYTSIKRHIFFLCVTLFSSFSIEHWQRKNWYRISKRRSWNGWMAVTCSIYLFL